VADPNELLTAFSTVGATITGAVAVIVAWGKAREMASKPLDDLKSSLTVQISALDTKISSLRKELDTLNVHFDPKGGDVRGKLDSIESRLAKMDSLAANERAELKGLISDLRPILTELRERS
jgi:ABC-type transporter Mla subunit MlaD